MKEVALRFDSPRVQFAIQVEERVTELLAELKPDRHLPANVEWYAAIVMEICGIPPEPFTSTFACARALGWAANILEQTRDPKIIRPSARYIGEPAPAHLARELMDHCSSATGDFSRSPSLHKSIDAQILTGHTARVAATIADCHSGELLPDGSEPLCRSRSPQCSSTELIECALTRCSTQSSPRPCPSVGAKPGVFCLGFMRIASR